MKMRIWLIILGYVIYAPISVYATNNDVVRYLGIEHGLSNNYVTAIYQDSDGFMWFGTQNGLNRYDGYQFKIYNHQPDNPASLAGNRVTDIIADQEGQIWVGMKKGASVIDTRGNVKGHLTYIDNLENIPKSIDFSINGLKINKDGQLFAASEKAGLLYVSKERRATLEAIQIPLLIGKEERFEYHAQAMDFDNQGNLWLVVQRVGLCRYEPKANSVVPVSSDVRTATCLAADDHGNIWMGTDYGLARYVVETQQTTSYTQKDGLSSTEVASLRIVGDNHQLWICTDGGGITVMDIHTGNCTYVEDTERGGILSSSAVFAVFRDAASRYWIGTLRGGINVIDPKSNQFRVIRQNKANYSSSAKDFILSFAENREGNVWIGTDGAGLTYWNREDNVFSHYQHHEGKLGALTSDFITSLLVDKNGVLWAATYGGGINKFNEQTRTFKQYTCINPERNYENNRVWRLYEDRERTIWATTLAGGGLYRLNRATDQFELYDASIPNGLSILEDDEGIMWFGTFAYLIRLDRKTREVTQFKIGHAVRFICESGQDSLWVGTEGRGLLHVDKKTGTWINYTEAHGLPDNALLDVLTDDHGNFWISTFNGITKFNPHTRKFHNFHQSDGLQSNQFNYNAALRLSTGEFLFGGIHGFNTFFPDSIRIGSAMPHLVLTDFRINNQPYYLSPGVAEAINLQNIDRLVLAHDEAVISVAFSALEYSSPDKIKYAYFLEGWDNDWNEVGSQRTAHYSRLEAGNYTLHIRSTNAGGEWNPEGRLVLIEVLPPWWRTIWAYGLYLTALLGMGYAYLYYDRRQTKLRYEVKIARLDVEREKELNEKKLAFFTHISHEFRTPLTLIINPIKELLYSKDKEVDNRELATVYNNSRRLLGLVDQLLLFRKADDEADVPKWAKIDIVTLCKEVFLCFSQYAKSKGIGYRFASSVEQLDIYVDREKMEIVLFNLVNNAIKFTPEGGNVTVSIHQTERFVDVHVADTGCGIPAHVGNTVFNRFYRDLSSGSGKTIDGFGIGLFLVKKFVDSHQGLVTYTSEEGSGTCFSVKLKRGKQHLANSYIFEDIGEHSVFLNELLGQEMTDPLPTVEEVASKELEKVTALVSSCPLLLVIDDNEQIRHYVRQIFEHDYVVHEAASGEEGWKLTKALQPDIILSDVVMEGGNGIELCATIKQDASLSHIPIILLTGSSTAEIKLQGIESGADDYITKPFDKAILRARVSNILKSRNQLQQYFYNEVTLGSSDFKIATEYRDFLDRCIVIVEEHLDNPTFNVGALAEEMGMSQSNLYKRVKSISGKSTSEFIRFIRLRKVAQLLISTDSNVSEAAFAAGFNDMKYFREQFYKLFGVKPSEYKRKFHATMSKKHTLNDKG